MHSQTCANFEKLKSQMQGIFAPVKTDEQSQSSVINVTEGFDFVRGCFVVLH